jgi:ubiquitin carboxyl-terminal hydrolase 7
VDTRDNVYLLHSVLVHSGDVHGGHYYSYVKPQKGFAKAAAVAQAAADGGGGGGGGFVAVPRAAGSEKGQYFRFDDDEVLGP